MTQYETLLYETSGGIARLTLNRPERRNGVTNRMVRELHEATTEAAADPSLRVLVLTGAGDAFSPGADLTHFTSGEADEPARHDAFRATVLLREMPAVTIAAVNGACAGAGMGWACACDLRVAAASARFNTAFLGVAVAGDMGLPWSLPRLVGAAKARELSFMSEKFDSAEALRIGLVAKVVEPGALAATVDEMAARLAAASPLALRTLKANYLAAERMSFGDYIDFETERHLRVAASPQTAEAFRAFLEKRPPRFEEVS